MNKSTTRTAPAAVHRPSETLSTKSRKALSIGKFVPRIKQENETPPPARPWVRAEAGDFPSWPDTRAGSMRAFSIPSHGVLT